MTKRLFHFAAVTLWEAFAASEAAGWEPPSLKTEGFVHLSFAEQLAGTLEVHFQSVDTVYLLDVDPSALGDRLRIEPSRDGMLFPHLYGPLARREVRGAWKLERDGTWRVPRLAEDPREDEPPASAPFV